MIFVIHFDFQSRCLINKVFDKSNTYYKHLQILSSYLFNLPLSLRTKLKEDYANYDKLQISKRF
jgi:uncharacterized C2H2 Zn-finger protein